MVLVTGGSRRRPATDGAKAQRRWRQKTRPELEGPSGRTGAGRFDGARKGGVGGVGGWADTAGVVGNNRRPEGRLFSGERNRGGEGGVGLMVRQGERMRVLRS